MRVCVNIFLKFNIGDFCEYAKIKKIWRSKIMTESIQAIYENGILRPLQPLNLPENKIVSIDVRDEISNGEETHQDKVSRALREAKLTSQMKFPNAKRLSDKERKRQGKLFSGEKSLGEYIDEDREARG